MTRGAAGLFRLTTCVNTGGGSTSRKATVSWTFSHSTVSCSRKESTTRTKACFLEPSTSIDISSSGRSLLKFMLGVQGFLFRLSIVELGRTNSGARTVWNFGLHPSNVTLYPSFSHVRMVQTYQRPSWRPSHFFPIPKDMVTRRMGSDLWVRYQTNHALYICLFSLWLLSQWDLGARLSICCFQSLAWSSRKVKTTNCLLVYRSLKYKSKK